jgi:hypothetical protein
MTNILNFQDLFENNTLINTNHNWNKKDEVISLFLYCLKEISSSYEDRRKTTDWDKFDDLVKKHTGVYPNELAENYIGCSPEALEIHIDNISYIITGYPKNRDHHSLIQEEVVKEYFIDRLESINEKKSDNLRRTFNKEISQLFREKGINEMEFIRKQIDYLEPFVDDIIDEISENEERMELNQKRKEARVIEKLKKEKEKNIEKSINDLENKNQEIYKQQNILYGVDDKKIKLADDKVKGDNPYKVGDRASTKHGLGTVINVKNDYVTVDLDTEMYRDPKTYRFDFLDKISENIIIKFSDF